MICEPGDLPVMIQERNAPNHEALVWLYEEEENLLVIFIGFFACFVAGTLFCFHVAYLLPADAHGFAKKFEFGAGNAFISISLCIL